MEKKNGSRVRIGLYVLFQIYDNIDKSATGPLSVEQKTKRLLMRTWEETSELVRFVQGQISISRNKMPSVMILSFSSKTWTA